MKRFKFYVLLTAICIVGINGYSQTITSNILSKVGRFNTCGTTPIVTTTFVSGNGSAVVGGALVCNNPADSTTLDVVLSNLTWNKDPGNNWLHALYFSNNAGMTILTTTILTPPTNWVFTSQGCLGSCPTGGQVNGGRGYYFAGPGQSCCPNGGTTPSPCDNYGDPILNCTTPFSTGFRVRIKNSSFVSTSFLMKLRADSDGNTGCWTTPDLTPNSIIFSFNTVTCPPNQPNPTLCNPFGSASFVSNFSGVPHQWQQSTDSVNFTNIVDNANFSGTNTSVLNLTNIPSSWYGYQYRYIVNGYSYQVFTLKFSNNWVGNVDNDWNNPANWSCGSVPDAFTDVNIQCCGITINVTQNCSVRSLTILSGATVNVNSGVVFTIIH